MNAFAEVAFADADQGLVDHLQSLAIIVALAEQEFLGIGTGGPVGNILSGILVGGTAVGLGAIPVRRNSCCRISKRFLKASSFFYR